MDGPVQLNMADVALTSCFRMMLTNEGMLISSTDLPLEVVMRAASLILEFHLVLFKPFQNLRGVLPQIILQLNSGSREVL